MNQDNQVGGHNSKRFDHKLENIRNKVLNMGRFQNNLTVTTHKAAVEVDALIRPSSA